MSVLRVTPGNRKEIYIPAQDGAVTIKPPAEATIAEKMALISKVMMIGVPAMMITMMVIMFTTGMGSNPMYMMMMGMMMLSMVGGRLVGTASNSGEVERSRRDSFLELNQLRPQAHALGEAQHHAAVQNWPPPAALPSRAAAGHASMWTAGMSESEDAAFSVATQRAGGSAGAITADPYLTARVGKGLVPLEPPITPDVEKLPIVERMEPVTLHNFAAFLATHNVVPNCPVALSLRPPAIGMRGDETHRMHLARTMLLSAAGSHSARKLHVGVVTKNPDEWDWLKWLPHSEDILAEGPTVRHVWSSMRAATEHIAAAQNYLTAADARFLVVVDLPDESVYIPKDVAHDKAHAFTVDEDTGIIALKNTTLLVVRSADDEQLCPLADRIHVSESGTVSAPGRLDIATVDSTTREDAEVIAQQLGAYEPEGFRTLPSLDATAATGVDATSAEVPDFLDSLFGDPTMDIEDYDVQAAWAANDPGDDLITFIGAELKGHDNVPTNTNAIINFLQAASGGSGHSGLFSGGTGTGKSFALQEMLAVLCARYSPQRINFIAADFKGNATFSPFRKLPHFVATISNLEGAAEEVFRFGDVLDGERKRREALFDRHGAGDLLDYRRLRGLYFARGEEPPADMPNVPDLFIVIDEFAEFASKNREYVKLLEELGRVVRSLGMHLFLGSQTLSAEVIGQAVEHYQVGFSMYVRNPNASRFVLQGDDGATNLPLTRIGRYVVDEGGKFKYGNFTAHNHARPYLSGASSLAVRAKQRVESATGVTDTSMAAADTGAVSEFRLHGRYADQRSVSLTRDGSEAPVVIDAPKSRREEIIDNAGLTHVERDSLPTQLEALIDHIVNSVGDYAKGIHKPWTTPLSTPMTLADVPSNEWEAPADANGPVIRIGDVDIPEKHVRIPMNLDFSNPAQASLVVSGRAGTGVSTMLKTAVVSSAIRYSGRYLSWMICDGGGTGLSCLEDMPNVAGYAAATDDDMWDRLLGEVRRIISVREKAWQAQRYNSFEDYLKNRDEDGVTGDPYGYIVLVIDELDAAAEARDKSGVERWVNELADLRSAGAYGIRFVSTIQGNRHSRTFGEMGKFSRQMLFSSNRGEHPLNPSSNQQEFRSQMERLPANQPGRPLDTSTVTELGHTSYRHGLVMLPINAAIEPTTYRHGRPHYDTRNIPVNDAIRDIAAQMRAQHGPATRTHEVAAVPTKLSFESVLNAYNTYPYTTTEPRLRPVPIGMNCSSGELILLDPAQGKHLAVLGQVGAGTSTTLRSYMKGVQAAFSPDEVMVVCIDGGGDLYQVSQDLKETGHMTDNSYILGKAATMEGPIKTLQRVLSDRLPTQEELGDRSRRDWFEGEEIFLFVDQAERLVSPGHGGSAADGTLEALAALIEEYDDIGFHMIVGYRASDAGNDIISKGKLLNTLITGVQSPYMMLSAPVDTMPIERRRFRREVPGRGRFIVPKTNAEVRIQISHTS